MISYDRLEDAIYARLQPLQTLGYEVQALPDTEQALSRAAGHKSRITVAYATSNFLDNSDSRQPEQMLLAGTAQRELCDLIVSVEAQRLRGVSGAYEAMRYVYLLLVGYKPEGWGKIVFRTTKFVESEKGLFTFYLTISVDRFVVENVDDHGTPIGLDGIIPTLPLLEEVTYNIETT